MGLDTLFLKWGLKVKVLHRLRGRLRVEILALRKVPPEKRAFAQNLISALVLPKGIKSIEPSFITGSVLLKYDADAITEQQVLTNIQEILNSLANYHDELWSIGRENGSAAIEKVNGVINTVGRKNKQGGEDSKY